MNKNDNSPGFLSKIFGRSPFSIDLEKSNDEEVHTLSKENEISKDEMVDRTFPIADL